MMPTKKLLDHPMSLIKHPDTLNGAIKRLILYMPDARLK